MRTALLAHAEELCDLDKAECPHMLLTLAGPPDTGGQRCCAKKQIPPTTINAIPATRKSGRSRLPALAWRSVPGEVGGRSSVQTRSHPIPV